ncbi:MAG: methyltransferase domain-containing protein [Patescibacteria group bacterium]
MTNVNKEKTIDTYNKIAPKYSKGHFAHFWIDEFEIYKNLIDGNKVLDIGCGAGRDASVFINNNFDYTGIDASEGMLKVASERVPKGIFKQMDFYSLDFLDGTFDGFWATASFLHIPKEDVGKVINETKRVVKSGGVGFISIKEKTDKDEGLIEEDKYGGIARYFAFYNQEEFKKILEDNGLEVIRVTSRIEDDEIKTKWLCYFVKKV